MVRDSDRNMKFKEKKLMIFSIADGLKHRRVVGYVFVVTFERNFQQSLKFSSLF